MDDQGAIEIRLLSRPGALSAAASGEQLDRALLEEDVVGVSYVLIETPDADAPTRSAPEALTLQETLAELRASGLSADYVVSLEGIESADLLPTALYIPGTEVAVFHGIKWVIGVIHGAKPVLKTAGAISESVELIDKVSAKMRSGADRPVNGGTLEGAIQTARTALAEVLGCDADNKTLKFTDGSQTNEPGVFVCAFRHGRAQHRVTVVHHGKGGYAIRTIEKLPATSK